MARLDIDTYRNMYLKEVEEHMMEIGDSIPNFTTQNLHMAIMCEMNRADDETWEVEVPDDKSTAIKEAEDRVIHHIKTHKDLSKTASF